MTQQQKIMFAKQTALDYLSQLKEIAKQQNNLFQSYENKKRGVNLFKRIKLNQEYIKQRDKLDFKADAITHKYTKLLSRFKPVKRKDFIKYAEGLLDKNYVCEIIG